VPQWVAGLVYELAGVADQGEVHRGILLHFAKFPRSLEGNLVVVADLVQAFVVEEAHDLIGLGEVGPHSVEVDPVALDLDL